MGIGKTRFFAIIKECKKDPTTFSIEYLRKNATNNISHEVEKNIVASARCKPLEALLSTKYKEELGMSQTESRLLGDRIGKWVISRKDISAPNQIIFEVSKGNTSFARRYSSRKIKLTAYDVEDLDILFDRITFIYFFKIMKILLSRSRIITTLPPIYIYALL